MTIRMCLLLSLLWFAAAAEHPRDTGSVADSLSTISSDSIALSPADTGALVDSAKADSMAESDVMEDEFQTSLDSLFGPESLAFDTSYWSTTMINTSRFDPATWTDTARIVLADSLLFGKYAHPFAGYITSNFGPRRMMWHFGVDLKLYKGDTVRTAFDGVVRVTKYERRGYGRVVVVRHRSGLETIYGHLSKIIVSVNQNLRAGEVIGLGGNTGRSTGSHLHFEIRYRGQPFDPNHIVSFETFALKSDTLVLCKADYEYLIELRKIVWHKVRKGDTLGHIARKYGTTVSKLCQLNHITSRTILSIGRKLIVRKIT